MRIDPELRRLFALACLALLVGAIFVGGEQPGAGRLFPPPWDKMAHLLAYGTIGMLAALAFPARSLAALLLIVAGIGSADEIHQMFLPGREAGLGDLLADVAGGLLVLPAVARLRLFYYSGYGSWKRP